ncbi:MAG: cytochrome-c peroxidase [Hyphomonadaceae bacterium]|nr:cytochrome-c peroxidase [Hyphomonadaceae bacterium]
MLHQLAAWGSFQHVCDGAASLSETYRTTFNQTRQWSLGRRVAGRLRASRGCRGRVSKFSFAALVNATLAIVAIQTPDGCAPIETSHSGPNSFYARNFERRPSAGELSALGRSLFADRSLSASGELACSSCHDPAHAYGPATNKPVVFGGPDMSLPGVRAIPSLTYQQAVPPFSEHFSETDGDDSIDQGPAGGRGWDGRAASAHEQAAIPLLSPVEMANADGGALVGRLRRSPNAALFRATFGEHVLDNAALSWNGALLALEVFQQSAPDFYPYTSKYDAWLRGKIELSAHAPRGLELFNDPAKGNCAQCHPSSIKRGQFPQFTDYGFVALGVPRNANIPANQDPGYFDLGLCGPYRAAFTNRADYCGLFRTPSLRNVALRKTFFHNGVFRDLTDVLHFYVERDLSPERFYPGRSDGAVNKFDDLPSRFWLQINVEAPFRNGGGKPALTEDEIHDIINFLGALSDGYQSASLDSSEP